MTIPLTEYVREKRMAKIVELGCAGHFICANDCRWRRHTQVGNYRVSTVGDLYYRSEENKRQTVGSGLEDFFETMVFKLRREKCDDNDGCGCRRVKEWSELECIRYKTAGEAQKGHEAMIRKYARLK
jgi:hypothetical protein